MAFLPTRPFKLDLIEEHWDGTIIRLAVSSGRQTDEIFDSINTWVSDNLRMAARNGHRSQEFILRGDFKSYYSEVEPNQYGQVDTDLQVVLERLAEIYQVKIDLYIDTVVFHWRK